MSLFEMMIPCKSPRKNALFRWSTASEIYFRQWIIIWFRILGMHPTPPRCSDTFYWDILYKLSPYSGHETSLECWLLRSNRIFSVKRLTEYSRSILLHLYICCFNIHFLKLAQLTNASENLNIEPIFSVHLCNKVILIIFLLWIFISSFRLISSLILENKTFYFNFG